jgi:hypothetical protein
LSDALAAVPAMVPPVPRITIFFFVIAFLLAFFKKLDENTATGY